MDDAPLVIGEERAEPPAPRHRHGVVWSSVGALLLAGAVVVSIGGGGSASPPATTPVVLGAPDAGLLPLGFSGAVLMVVTDGNETTLETLTRTGWAAPVELPPLDWARFDGSGTRLAGTAGPGSGLSALWVGTVDGVMRRMGGGVRAFAWHDTEPGMLAWTELSGSADLALTVADLAAGDDPVVLVELDVGQLRKWGSWGFAFLQPGRPMRSLLLDGSGEPLGEVAGYPVGEVLPGLPGFTSDGIDTGGGGAGTYAFEGGREQVAWVPPGEYVRAVEPREDGDLLAVIASTTGLREPGRTLLVEADGEVRRWDARATGPAPLAWDSSGEFALTATTSDDGTAAIDIVAVATGERRTVPAGPRVILDLAVGSPGDG